MENSNPIHLQREESLVEVLTGCSDLRNVQTLKTLLKLSGLE